MIDGSNIASIGCRGASSCAQSMVTVACQSSPMFGPPGCRLDCLGDSACEGVAGVPRASRFVVANSMGLLCGHESCRYGSFALNSNMGGRLVCGGDSGCLGASITINNIDAIHCSGEYGCQYAEILVINPQNGFKVSCSGLLFVDFVPSLSTNRLSSHKVQCAMNGVDCTLNTIEFIGIQPLLFDGAF